MANAQSPSRANMLLDDVEIRIAIGAATAANCIPCFEHLYEKAINEGVPLEDIKRASDIAGLVKNGAHSALTSLIEELTGTEEVVAMPCSQAGDKCSCG